MIDADQTLTNGRFELPSHARGVLLPVRIPITRSAGQRTRSVDVTVVRTGKLRRFSGLLHSVVAR